MWTYCFWQRYINQKEQCEKEDYGSRWKRGGVGVTGAVYCIRWLEYTNQIDFILKTCADIADKKHTKGYCSSVCYILWNIIVGVYSAPEEHNTRINNLLHSPVHPYHIYLSPGNYYDVMTSKRLYYGIKMIMIFLKTLLFSRKKFSPDFNQQWVLYPLKACLQFQLFLLFFFSGFRRRKDTDCRIPIPSFNLNVFHQKNTYSISSIDSWEERDRWSTVDGEQSVWIWLHRCE